ncbi:MAG: helix-turn-helix transcriptional regulator [Pseudomonadota bacterium]
MARRKNPRIGSSFSDFLAEQGIEAEVTGAAIKQVIAYQLGEAMAKQGLSKTAMAERMNTSRQQLDRLLDPNNESVTLQTLQRAARAVGRRLKVELV